MRTLKLSLRRGRQGFLSVIVPALFLVLALRPGPAAALADAPPGLPPQIFDTAMSHTCALTPTGAADCWADDFYGQAADQPGPYTQVTLGNAHSCALTPAGAVDCWGNNGSGQADDQPGPYTQVSAGSQHTCALTVSGSVDCWGSNDYGESDDQPGPYTRISAGNSYTCALTASDSVDCWGLNSSGQADDQAGPYTQVSTGGFHTCALTPSGAADCWGDNTLGAADDQPGPYIQISAGSYHSCALTPSGAADCWGGNGFGQADDQPGPYSWISAGSNHTCALTISGSIDCWGNNGLGQADDQPGPYRPWEPNEPDDTSGTATPLLYEETSANHFIGVADDMDYYQFSGSAGQRFIVEVKAGSIGSGLDSWLTLYDTDGTTVITWNDDYSGVDSRLDITIPADGTYYLSVEQRNMSDGGPRHFYELTIRPYSLYLTATKSGTVGGVAATPQDILRYDNNLGAWSMWLDGSDVGITKALTAFSQLPDGDWLLVFKASQPTPAGTFTPWDIARFTPDSMGDTTAGTFSWFFDGSDVGLTTSAEKIDAVDWAENMLMISTGGTLAVPGPGGTFKAQDEDMVLFSAFTLGETTSGDWLTFFDGTAVPGMKGEDLASAHYDTGTATIRVAITGSFKIGGVSGNGKDILTLTPAPVPGGYSVSKISLPTIGFNLNIGGFESD